jgi:adenine-specific DNA-methyltransferase
MQWRRFTACKPFPIGILSRGMGVARRARSSSRGRRVRSVDSREPGPTVAVLANTAETQGEVVGPDEALGRVAKRPATNGESPSPLASELEATDLEDLGPDHGIVLSWFGRKQARVSIPKPRVLEPVPEHSDPTDEDPGNILIEGDNRQAMVSLLPQFAGRVDVVLIDPPYNTGKRDFRYDDHRFHDPDADTRKGDFVSAEDGGRHAKWLNQMAPTLRLIRELMAPHAVIFIHIDDRELSRLLILMEEIFDESNRIGMLVWKSSTDNNPSQVVVEHEYILVYAKNKANVASSWRGQMERRRQALQEAWEGIVSAHDTFDERVKEWLAFLKANKKSLGSFASNYRHVDENGPFMTSDLSFPGGGGPSFEVLHPNGKPTRVPPHGYRVSPEVMAGMLAAKRIHFGKDETSSVLFMRYLSDAEDDPLRSTILEFGGKGVNADIKRLFPEDPDVFPNPKPVPLEEYLLSFVSDRDSLVLDCFGGSGTTGHAVMRLNKRDDGHRRFILIEEGNEGDGYATTLTAERLKRARKLEGLAGGFSFFRVGPRIDVEAFEQLQHRHLVSTILQTDASGRGGGVKPVEGGKLVVGYNTRQEAICLYYDPKSHTPINRDLLREMYLEADALGLARPLRVYGESCDVFGSESFRFFKLPDEVINNLTVALRGGR